jgi:hydroxymethylglutaryl-CoA lyase
MSRPSVLLYEEAMREGMQIESADIAAEDKVRLLDALSLTGLSAINVGSFVSPRYTPQMANIDDVLAKFTPVDGIHYYYLALNPRGVERASAYMPPLRPQFDLPYLRAELCDTFLRRNNNRTKADIPARWAGLVEKAKNEGATEARVDLGSAFGSNFEGGFSHEERMFWIREGVRYWTEAGIEVTALGLFDPMSWCMPHWTEETIEAVLAEFPSITRFHLHMHDARGMAVPSIYAALRTLDDRHRVSMDVTAGGIGGCPYCGTGRATGMAPTEDVVTMCAAMGIDTGVDIDKLIEAVWLLEEIIGRPTPGHVSKAGPLPGPDQLYDPNLPLVETHEQVKHFKLGPSAVAGGIIPWKEPIPAPELPHR